MKSNKTTRLVGLFAATALALSAGCSPVQPTSAQDGCLDDNNDGYCDDDGSRIGSSYFYRNGKKYYSKTHSGVSSGSSYSTPSSSSSSSTGISSGTSSSKGGIGSSDGTSSS